jgi:hypothetical protein
MIIETKMDPLHRQVGYSSRPCWRPNWFIVAGGHKKVLSQHKVRTSLTDRTLDSMFPAANPTRMDSDSNAGTVEPSRGSSTSREIKESECYLTSVRKLRQAVLKRKHKRELS